MSFLTRALLYRVLDRRAAADLARLPAIYRYAGRYAGGGLMSRIAIAGLLRLALRWPALAGVLIVSMLAARVLAKQRRGPDNVPASR